MTTTTLNVVTTPAAPKAPRVPLTTVQRLEIAFRSLDAVKNPDTAVLEALLSTMKALKSARDLAAKFDEACKLAAEQLKAAA